MHLVSIHFVPVTGPCNTLEPSTGAVPAPRDITMQGGVDKQHYTSPGDCRNTGEGDLLGEVIFKLHPE